MASTARVTYKDGTEVVVNHQFGTVRRNLNLAATQRPHEKTGEVVGFAEFHTDEGRRLVNPSEVRDVSEIRD